MMASRDHAQSTTSGKGTLTLAALTAALLVSGCGPTPREKNIAQGAYDYGVYVGRILGLCQHLREIYVANPDSDWAKDPETVTTIATCRKAESDHAPGKKETIHVPAAHRLPLARGSAEGVAAPVASEGSREARSLSTKLKGEGQ